MTTAAVEEPPGLLKHKGSKPRVPSPSELPFAPQGPISHFCCCVLPAGSGPAGTLLSQPQEGMVPLGRTRRVTLGTAPTSDPFISPPSPGTFGQEQGSEAADV